MTGRRRRMTIGMARRLLTLGACVAVAACATYRSKPVALESFAPSAPAIEAASPRVELGRLLFFDPRLSGANDVARASCHQPERGFEDGRAVPIGTRGRVGRLSTPTLIGVGAATRLMWDGRVRSLERQALMPIEHADEMDQDLDALPGELRADPKLRAAFAAAFPDAPTVSNARLARALAEYQRTIRPGEAPFDRHVAGDRSALSAAGRRGLALFTGKAGCARCHSGPLLSDGRRHDVGMPDRGQGTRFKTPTLRDVGRRAPYMHDGSLPTLAAVIDHYAGGALRRRGVAAAVSLAPAERADLVAFLGSLDSDR